MPIVGPMWPSCSSRRRVTRVSSVHEEVDWTRCFLNVSVLAAAVTKRWAIMDAIDRFPGRLHGAFASRSRTDRVVATKVVQSYFEANFMCYLHGAGRSWNGIVVCELWLGRRRTRGRFYWWMTMAVSPSRSVHCVFFVKLTRCSPSARSRP